LEQANAILGEKARTASIHRQTGETSIDVDVTLDGIGKSQVSTTIPLLDRQFAEIAASSGISLNIAAVGTLPPITHHCAVVITTSIVVV
jgi:imidazoleglycerol-phosphate dehydratase